MRFFQRIVAFFFPSFAYNGGWISVWKGWWTLCRREWYIGRVCLADSPRIVEMWSSFGGEKVISLFKTPWEFIWCLAAKWDTFQSTFSSIWLNTLYNAVTGKIQRLNFLLAGSLGSWRSKNAPHRTLFTLMLQWFFYSRNNLLSYTIYSYTSEIRLARVQSHLESEGFKGLSYGTPLFFQLRKIHRSDHGCSQIMNVSRVKKDYCFFKPYLAEF